MIVFDRREVDGRSVLFYVDTGHDAPHRTKPLRLEEDDRWNYTVWWWCDTCRCEFRGEEMVEVELVEEEPHSSASLL